VQAGFAQGGQHALAAELLLFVGIVGLRAVATYGPAPVVKGKTEPKNLPADQFGPLFILGNGFALFFVLAFMAARGGTWAKVAVAAGLLVDVALLLKSSAHLSVLTQVYASPRTYTPVSLAATRPGEQLPAALQYEIANRALPPAPKGQSASSMQSYARKMMPHYGLSQADFGLLVKLWDRESGWRVTATNPGSGAYGIPQSLPANKMASAGADWKTDGATQIRWGLQDIKDMYGSVAAAWAHELHYGWY
jgi:hypothetical protein